MSAPHAPVVALPNRLWHVTLTATGSPVADTEVREALQRLAVHHPFLLSARYSADRAEIQYWEEDSDLSSAAARAQALWSQYVELAALPAWEVVGLEVVDQETRQGRDTGFKRALAPAGTGHVRPF